ncbi:MAG: glycosyltransferase family 1 protein [Patescibacteria group bacterium]
MKIGIDASRFRDSQATGVEWYSWHIINGIVRENARSKNPDEIILYTKNGFDETVFEDYREHVKVKKIEAKRFWTLWALSREIKRNKPDNLFVPSHAFPLILPKKSVIMIHDVAFKYLRKAYSFLHYHYLNWSCKFAVKHATTIVVPSEATKKDLVNFYNCDESKIKVVLHGFEAPADVDDKIFEESEVLKYFELTPKSKYLLFVGRLETKKNLVRLVEAFALFEKKNPDYKLVLAGKRGVGFQKLLKKVNELSLAHKVIMPGYITQEEKTALFKYCSVFTFPSLYEGFGLPILEAFYFKKPVLCSSISSLPEVAEEAVHYIDPYDVNNMAEGLELLVYMDKYMEGLVAKGSEQLKKFSWQKTAKETLEILKK